MSYEIKRRYKLIENDQCTNCGGDADRVGWLCNNCLTKQNQRVMERYRQRRQHGLCVLCASKSETAYCRKCLDKRKKYHSPPQREKRQEMSKNDIRILEENVSVDEAIKAIEKYFN